ncbi:type I-F CRISPR-associated protein Csy1 [Arsenophonus sp. aPb]|uniref:type I-F CRISPR-associated protein Csy1 n=1 Tax=Arsenophonus sp. aPb TaxID=3041619 RepID=UPI00246934AC|nr:type I-F CRISPR-associated protein Csy1 [Arsenophonus sp. aPb]WGL98874.1 type I-F CRISPR-associated protein Csy1 [Arsenophonus sp. aPb]
MLDPAIEAFFTVRKAEWLKKNLKSSDNEEQINTKRQECERVFSLANWLPERAAKINSRALTTHPSTFTHTATGIGKKNLKNQTFVTPIIYSGKRQNDGFLRSGNVVYKTIDSVGNAAEMGIENFLRLKLADGASLLEHIENETDLAKSLLSIDGHDYNTLRTDLLAIKAQHPKPSTSSKIKQIYFPIDDGYHLLSLLTPSCYLFELRQRIDQLRFAEENKAARQLKSKNEYSEHGFSEIYGITTMSFGGTKPQNASMLSSQNGGKAHLLLSLPPTLQTRTLRLPQHNFFTDTFNPFHIKETFQAFHCFLHIDKNNINLRNQRDSYIQEYIEHIILIMYHIRQKFSENNIKLPENLPDYQKIWLFPNRQDERNQTNDWLTYLIEVLARQFISSYQKIIEKKYIQLGDAELKKIIQLVVENNKESLR